MAWVESEVETRGRSVQLVCSVGWRVNVAAIYLRHGHRRTLQRYWTSFMSRTKIFDMHGTVGCKIQTSEAANQTLLSHKQRGLMEKVMSVLLWLEIE